MNELTKEQLEQIAITFGLTIIVPPKDARQVRDGIVSLGDMVWWRNMDGPEYVKIDGSHWDNIGCYPNAYQIAEPSTKVEYLD